MLELSGTKSRSGELLAVIFRGMGGRERTSMKVGKELEGVPCIYTLGFGKWISQEIFCARLVEEISQTRQT